jgi:HSP20 family molecular chaperone IbpA
VSNRDHDSLVDHFGEFGDRLRGDSWQPDIDVFETETALVVRAESAGVRSQDLNVADTDSI